MLFPDVVSDTQLIDRSQSEFIFAPRCDNLFSTYAAMEGIIASTDATGPSDGRVSMVACFDNEEVGSVSAYGAESNFIESCIERVAIALKLDGESEAEAYQRTLASSFLLSSDVGHSIHPSFMDKHEDNHRPLMNSGIAIKSNSKQRYATTSQTVFPLRRIAAEAGVPLQEYAVRNDCPCGSTSAIPSFSLRIPPRLALSLLSRLNSRTSRFQDWSPYRRYRSSHPIHALVCPFPSYSAWPISLILASFRIREMAGTRDVTYLIDLFAKFFEKFGTVDTLASTID